MHFLSSLSSEETSQQSEADSVCAQIAEIAAYKGNMAIMGYADLLGENTAQLAAPEALLRTQLAISMLFEGSTTICFEGVSGSGKDTQMKLLGEHFLLSQGRDFYPNIGLKGAGFLDDDDIWPDFRGFEAPGARALSRRKAAYELLPEEKLYGPGEASWHLLQAHLLETLYTEGVVFMNRGPITRLVNYFKQRSGEEQKLFKHPFITSGIPERMHRASGANQVDALCAFVPIPTVTLYIDVPTEELERRQLMNSEKDRSQRRSNPYIYPQVARLLQAAQPDRYIVIDGTGSPADVHKRILSELESRKIFE